MANSIVFKQSTTDIADSNSYTFSSQDFGTAEAGRYIIIGIISRKSTTAATITGVTIGGVTATIVVQRTNTITNTDVAGIAIALVPDGATGNIVVTFSATMLRCAISVYRAVGLSSATPTDSDGSTASAPSVALDVPAGGFAIGMALTSATTTTSWTGLTENVDATLETYVTYSSALQEFASAETGRTMTATFGSSNESAGVFASWQFSTGTDVNSARNASIVGKSSANSSRSASITGGHILSVDYFSVDFSTEVTIDSSINAIITGKSATNASRNSVITGKSFINSSRNAVISGSETANDSFNGIIIGKDTKNDSINSKITGSNFISNNRNARIVGDTSIGGTILSKIIGSSTTFDGISARIKGYIHSEFNAKIIGKDSSEDSREAKIIGQKTDFSNREASVIGNAFVNDRINSIITGKDFSEDSRWAKITGQKTVDDSINANILGNALGLDTRNAVITGKDYSESSINAKLIGQKTDGHSRNASIIGNAYIVEKINSIITGQKTVGDSRGASILGNKTDGSNRDAKIIGSDSALGLFMSKISGVVVGIINATIKGGTKVNGDREAKIVGGEISIGVMTAHMKGGITTSLEDSVEATDSLHVEVRKHEVFSDSVSATESLIVTRFRGLKIGNIVMPKPNAWVSRGMEDGVFHENLAGGKIWDVSYISKLHELTYNMADFDDTDWQSIYTLYDNHLIGGEVPVYVICDEQGVDGYCLLDISPLDYKKGAGNKASLRINLTEVVV